MAVTFLASVSYRSLCISIKSNKLTPIHCLLLETLENVFGVCFLVLVVALEAVAVAVVVVVFVVVVVVAKAVEIVAVASYDAAQSKMRKS